MIRSVRVGGDRTIPNYFISLLRTEMINGKMMRSAEDPWIKVFGAAACHMGVQPLQNVWLGVSVENQPTADERIPLLLQTPAAKRFVSYEPGLAGVDYTNLKHSTVIKDIKPGEDLTINVAINALTGDWDDGWDNGNEITRRLDWIIVGGESGPGARPFDIAWARSVVSQCKTAGVACFVKQLGAEPFNGAEQSCAPSECCVHNYTKLKLKDRKGGTPEEWPEDLQVREFPA